MKSIKTNPNSAKEPDKGKIVTRKRHKKEDSASFVQKLKNMLY
jgi:hypothetical protein